ncbi:MAG TPA: ATP-dependent DNA ligase [Trebonia sp.]|nr:ATP-dependent DNA ligase [Trebonia sp.]
MLLAEVAEVSRAVAGSSGRLAKVAAIAAALRSAGPDEVPIVVAYLSGELPQRQIGVGWAALRSAPPAAAEPSLTVLGVDASFTEIGAVVGPGSVAERKRLVDEALRAATPEEQYFLVRLLSGELRQGALDGVMTEAVARASEVPVALVRRAVMLRGSLPAVAEAALDGGADALAEFGLLVGQPLKPMLASSAPSVEAALEKIAVDAAKAAKAASKVAGKRAGKASGKPGGKGTGKADEGADDAGQPDEAGETDEVGETANAAAVEWKLDGIRIQAHVSGGSVRLFTRTLDDITGRLPEVVSALAALPARTAVFDGELIALRPDGRPYAFQDTASRAASQGADGGAGPGGGDPTVPLSAFLFDLLHLDGADLIDLPDVERRAALAAVAPAEMLMPRLVTADVTEAEAFFRDSVAHGHEGVVVKSLATPYAAGRRGAGWIKVKPRHTLDLVVLAVEWGHGRRHGWLSNLHLGARDPETGGWVMLGKTFKGLTDELLTWQTARLLELEDHRDDWTVWVRPELVVEIAFDGVQRSPRYPGGVALRFARVLRYREDKPAAEADTIASVRELAAD